MINFFVCKLELLFQAYKYVFYSETFTIKNSFRNKNSKKNKGIGVVI